MAYETGTATDYLDLLDKLVTFLTTNSALVTAGQNWEVMRDESPPVSPVLGERELIFKAPGLAGTDEYYLGVMAFQNSGLDTYNWSMRGMVGFLDSVAFNAQPGVSPEVFTHLWNDVIPYWFIANGRRVIIVAKISTVYEMAYLGAYLPYSTPAQYPYPVIVGGTSSVSTLRWSDNTFSHKTFFDPVEDCLRVYYLDGTWQSFANTQSSLGSPAQQRNVWPYEGDSYQRQILTSVRDNVDGSSYTLPALMLTMQNPANNVLGEFDGLYFVSGYNNASENIVTIASQDYLVVQNVFRTNRWDYVAIKLS